MSTKRSRVHPKYKTKYRVANWPQYDRSLAQRGNLTVWLSPDAIARWNAKPSGRRGGQRKYSDLAIETALTLRLLLHLPLRQTEGFLLSIFELMGIHLDVPDHTTLSRRSGQLSLPLRIPQTSGPIDLVIDSSGLAIFGEGEWAAVKHGGKGIQGWKKLHLGVDETGVIVAQTLTGANVDDANHRHRAHRSSDRRGRHGHRRRRLRHATLLRSCRSSRGAQGRGPTHQDRAVSEANNSRSRSNRSPNPQCRSKAVEEGGRLPSTSPRRERLLSIQGDLRR